MLVCMYVCVYAHANKGCLSLPCMYYDTVSYIQPTNQNVHVYHYSYLHP